jgi:hypothetical protein
LRHENEKRKAMTKKEEAQKAKEMKAMYLELIALMLKRAGVKEEDIYRTAMKSWASKNLDLLTAAELKKYQAVIAP